MDYVMLEFLVCVGIVAGIAILVFASSLVLMLAHEGIARAFRAKSRVSNQTREGLLIDPALRDRLNSLRQQEFQIFPLQVADKAVVRADDGGG
jgi:hypothetical protein